MVIYGQLDLYGRHQSRPTASPPSRRSWLLWRVYAIDPYAIDPYAIDPYAIDPYA